MPAVKAHHVHQPGVDLHANSATRLPCRFAIGFHALRSSMTSVATEGLALMYTGLAALLQHLRLMTN